MKIVKQFLKIDEICSNVRNFMNLYEIGLRIVLDSMEFRRQLDSQPFFSDTLLEKVFTQPKVGRSKDVQ